MNNISVYAHPNEIVEAYQMLIQKEAKVRGVSEMLDVTKAIKEEILDLRR